MIIPSETITNLVRRPVDGCVMTSSGRRIPQPPWIVPELPHTAIAYDQWLLDQGRAEAAELGDEWMLARLEGMSGAAVDVDLRHLLSDYLFGTPNPIFEARPAPDADRV